MSTPLLDYLLTHEPLFRASRLPSLYSDLSVQKTTNPEGYAANVTAWTAAIVRAALSGHLTPSQNLLVLDTGEELLDTLVSERYGRPSGLGCVLDECVRGGKFVEEKEFLAAEASIYAKSWIPSPWAVLRWSLRQAGLEWSASYEINGGRLKQGKLVLVPALEEVGKRLQPLFQERGGQGLTNRVTSRESFAREVNEVLAFESGESEAATKTSTSILSERDLQVLLRYLSRDRQLLSYDGSTIKFKTATSSIPEPITQEDHSIASLKSLIQTLEQQTTTLSARISTLQAQAGSAVKNGNKTTALGALRSKKLAENTLQTRLSTLAQVEEIYTKVEAAVSQVDILSVMEASATTLKSLNHKIGGVERVEDVLESLREEVGKVDEVSGILSETGAVDQKALLDEGEVDDELEAMEREEREKVRRVEEERTKERLREVDAFAQLQKEREREKQRAQDQAQREKRLQESPNLLQNQGDKDKELEDMLSTSTEQLRKLDIDDPPQREKDPLDRMSERGTRESEPQPSQQQPVAEGAS